MSSLIQQAKAVVLRNSPQVIALVREGESLVSALEATASGAPNAEAVCLNVRARALGFLQRGSSSTISSTVRATFAALLSQFGGVLQTTCVGWAKELYVAIHHALSTLETYVRGTAASLVSQYLG